MRKVKWKMHTASQLTCSLPAASLSESILVGPFIVPNMIVQYGFFFSKGKNSCRPLNLFCFSHNTSQRESQTKS